MKINRFWVKHDPERNNCLLADVEMWMEWEKYIFGPVPEGGLLYSGNKNIWKKLIANFALCFFQAAFLSVIGINIVHLLEKFQISYRFGYEITGIFQKPSIFLNFWRIWAKNRIRYLLFLFKRKISNPRITVRNFERPCVESGPKIRLIMVNEIFWCILGKNEGTNTISLLW